MNYIFLYIYIYICMYICTHISSIIHKQTPSLQIFGAVSRVHLWFNNGMRKMSGASANLSPRDAKTTENYRGIGAVGGVGRTTGVVHSDEEEQEQEDEDEEGGVGETALAAVSTSIAGTLDDSTLSFKPGWNRHPQQQQQQHLRQQKRHHGWRRQSKRDYSKRDELCGMCGYKPKWMQIFNNPRALLFFLCSGSFIQGKYHFFFFFAIILFFAFSISYCYLIIIVNGHRYCCCFCLFFCFCFFFFVQLLIIWLRNWSLCSELWFSTFGITLYSSFFSSFLFLKLFF